MPISTLSWLLGLGAIGTAGLVVSSRASATEVSAVKPTSNLKPPKYRNNPGNIRFIADPAKRWQGMLPTARNGYAEFDTPENGVRAAYQQFAKYQREGLKTILQMITRWAPEHENPTSAYVQFLTKRVGTLADAPLDLSKQRGPFLAGVFRFEQGYDSYTLEEILQWAK